MLTVTKSSARVVWRRKSSQFIFVCSTVRSEFQFNRKTYTSIDVSSWWIFENFLESFWKNGKRPFPKILNKKIINFYTLKKVVDKISAKSGHRNLSNWLCRWANWAKNGKKSSIYNLSSCIPRRAPRKFTLSIPTTTPIFHCHLLTIQTRQW